MLIVISLVFPQYFPNIPHTIRSIQGFLYISDNKKLRYRHVYIDIEIRQLNQVVRSMDLRKERRDIKR